MGKIISFVGSFFLGISGVFAQNVSYENVELSIPLAALNGTSVDDLIIEIPVCKYDKTFALTFTSDDALLGVYSRPFNYVHGRYVDDDPIFHEEAEPRTTGITPTRMLVHTDGCGNDIPFRLGTNWMMGNEGSTMHKNGNTYSPQMWWSEGARFVDYYNGLMNHAGGDQSNALASIAGNQNEIVENLGFTPFVLGIPGGTSGFPEVAEELEDIYFMEAGSFSLKDTRLNMIESDMLKMRFPRTVIDTKVFAELKAMIDEKAFDTHWLNLFCHDIKNSETKVNGQLNTFDCFAMLDYVYDTYGKGGADNVWFASSPEIYEYLYTRLNSTIEKVVENGRLIIRINAAVLPHFYFKDLTLKLQSKNELVFSGMVLSSNITRGSYSSNGETALINLSFSEFPLQKAEKYTALYEAVPTTDKKEEALFFINLLSPERRLPFFNRLAVSSADELELPSSKSEPLFYMDKSHNSLHFLMTGEEPYTVFIFTPSGELVKQATLSGLSPTLPIDELSRGVYCVQVSCASKVREWKFTKG